MGYQALLFCPDEKTARTVTQVLSELDFSVIPCTEPFATVKKLMGEHFDAVVVDCDNEQNATLLFKSARNTVRNQASLAVAVVEGQAGVAKAFRIGANLVLTKPINVETAKGTLRVARGLLRKNEAAKPATGAASTGLKPVAAVPGPAKPAPQATIPTAPTARPAAPIAPLAAATASIPTQKTAAQPRVVAAIPTESTESDDIFEVSEETDSLPKMFSAVSSPATAERKIETAGRQPGSSAGFGTSAASAPAPAREPEPESPVEEVTAGGSSSSVQETSAPAPAFTFGGNVSQGAPESAGGGSKKVLLRVAVVVLIVGVGSAAWMQWIRSSGAATPFTHVAVPPVTAPATVPQVKPSAAPAEPSSAPSAPTSSATSSVHTSNQDSGSAPQATETAKASSAAQTASRAENAPIHPSKVSAEEDSSKPSASAPAANKVPATTTAAQPIVIKSGSSKPASTSEATTDAPAPSITAVAPADNAALPNLAGSQSTPTPVLQTVNVSQGVSEGLLVKRVQPVYPANALRLRREGAVQLMATISKDGGITTVKVLSGEPLLSHAAVEAVKQWKYKPYLLNGSPVEMQTQITVKFTLPH
jgi:TonB family protein